MVKRTGRATRAGSALSKSAALSDCEPIPLVDPEWMPFSVWLSLLKVDSRERFWFDERFPMKL